MGLTMKVILLMVDLMDMEEYSQMATCMKGSGKTELLKVRVFTHMKTELFMLEIGSMMSKMDRARKLGSTARHIKGNTNKD